MSLGDQEPILVDINFTNFVAIRRLEHDALTILNPFYDDLRQRNIGKFKFSLISAFF